MPDVKLPPGYQLIDSPAAPNPPAAPPPVQVPAGYKLLDSPAAGNTPVVTSTIRDDSGNTVAGSLWDSVKDFLSATWDQVNPMNAVHEYMDRPKQWKAVSDVLGTYQRADREGRHGQLTPDEEAKVREAMKVPLYDPGIAPPPTLEPVIQAGADAREGRFARAAGDLVGAYAVPLAVGKGLSKARTLSVPGLDRLQNQNPVVLADRAFAADREIPISAAVSTGNDWVKYGQKAADLTIGGSIAAEEAAGETRRAFNREGQALLNEVHPTPTNPILAGEHLRAKVAGNAREAGRAARIAYAPWEELAQDPANIHRVWTGDDPVTGKPVYENVALPVDMTPIKKVFLPIYERYKYTSTLADRHADPGLHALRNIVEGPNFKSAPVAELDLGALKEVIRDAGGDEFHGISEGMAKTAVRELDAQIRRAARSAKRSVERSPLPAGTGAPALGAGAAAPAIESAPVTSTITRGQETTVKVPGENRSYPARYEVRELDSLTPSHDPHSFQANRNYPYANDRDYTRVENQAKVVENSTPAVFDPSELVNDAPNALTGPPVVDAAGNVIGGNGRTMILGRVYEGDGKASGAYRTALEQRAGQFGLTSEQVAGMKQPVLVRVGDFGDTQAAISDLNKPGTNALRPQEQAIADARRVSPETLNKIGAKLEAQGTEATISSILDGPPGTEILQHLIDDGVISPSERPRLVNGNILTPAGRERVRSMMLGRYFEHPQQMDVVPDLVQSRLAKITGPLAAVEGTPFALTDQVKSALTLIEKATAAGLKLDDYMNQRGLFSSQEFPSGVVQMAKHLERTPTAQLLEKARSYADDAQYANGGAGLFGDVPTPEESFGQHFGGEIKEPAPAPTPAAAAATSAAPVAELEAQIRAKEGELRQEKNAAKAIALQREIRSLTDKAAAAKSAAAAGGPESTALVPAGTGTPETQQARAQNITREPILGPLVDGKPAGDEALGSLLLGRKATVEKWRSSDLLRVIRDEPVQAFDQATFARDAGINHLRKLEQQAPGVMREVGRAYLEHLFDTATNLEQAKPKTAYSSWLKMGDETKRILFGSPAMVENLNRFMSLVVRVAENPNPSGTAFQGFVGVQGAQLVFTPWKGVPLQLAGWQVSKLLHSPRGAKLLTQGLQMTLDGSKEKGRMGYVVSQIARMAAEPDDKKDDDATTKAAADATVKR